ncbi:hypothetical protein BC643_2762 [Mangrovibacterium diazotrophicum]|uniref:Uncharacterized protein n=1 Tax=Mangrovibacterium diazotrophicum TaxID=1261403 RepID=A0A419WA82_9BACT|nr:hypothetical protein BC643_2762 [Mangrovibacterium diazotrophicum]
MPVFNEGIDGKEKAMNRESAMPDGLETEIQKHPEIP